MQVSYYPSKVMRISQNYKSGNHKAHNQDSKIYDYPIDETYDNSKQTGWFIAPFDCQIVKKYQATTRNIWLTSNDEVITPKGNYYVTIQVCHIDKDIYNKLKVGQTFKQDEKIVRESIDKNSTGYHNHITAGYGLIKGTGWKENSKGKWVLQTTKGSQKPEDVFFIKTDIKILNNGNITWQQYKDNEKNFFPKKGWWGYGDRDENVNKISEFMRLAFPAYSPKEVLGNYYGKYLTSSIKEFQKRTGLEPDGNVGKKTLAKLKEYGFKC